MSIADKIEGKTPKPTSTVEAQVGVAEGVKIGCGMFIVLPLLLLLGGVALLFVCSLLSRATTPTTLLVPPEFSFQNCSRRCLEEKKADSYRYDESIHSCSCVTKGKVQKLW
ncbi:MAG TPA: hypothetical protein VKM54_04230 [Myxococcota bacterium]|nr:hypothetical protein [Myxococcota bacterium]